MSVIDRRNSMSVISDTSAIELEVGTVEKPPEVDEEAVQEYVRRELALSYQDLDIKGVGRLSAEDIRAAYATMGISLTLEECSWVVEEIDTTGEGVISFDDFSAAMYSEYDRTTTEEEMSIFFRSMDLMNDGLVDIGDIQIAFQKCGIKMSLTEAAEIMSDADDNCNAAIDFEEFKLYCQRIDGYRKLTEPKNILTEVEEPIGFNTKPVDPSILEKKNSEMDGLRKALLETEKEKEEKREKSMGEEEANYDLEEEIEESDVQVDIEQHKKERTNEEDAFPKTVEVVKVAKAIGRASKKINRQRSQAKANQEGVEENVKSLEMRENKEAGEENEKTEDEHTESEKEKEEDLPAEQNIGTNEGKRDNKDDALFVPVLSYGSRDPCGGTE